MAKANPFRFSTKYQDDETDLLYRYDRYYSSTLGRCLSRDATDNLLNPYQIELNPSESGFEASLDVVGWDKEAGRTFCDLSKPPGSPLTIIDNDKKCTRPCTQKHEDKHAADGQSCCDKARAAFQAKGANKVKVKKEWDKWMDDARLWAECRAYGASLACEEDLYCSAADCFVEGVAGSSVEQRDG